MRGRWGQEGDGGRSRGTLCAMGRTLSFILSEMEPQEGSGLVTDMI